MTNFLLWNALLSVSYVLCQGEEGNLDSNPSVGDGIDRDEAQALRQSPFQLATSHRNGESPITGTVEVTELDNVFYAFRGIRYASPPVGERRFREPEALLEDWTQLDTASDGPACPQTPKPGLSISEDCLWLNVFTPELSQLENPSLEAKYDVAAGFLHEHKFSKHAVMVFLHPTGPNWDSGWAGDDDYGPTHILDYEVLLVTVNYRIGTLGFGTGTNLGLLDQVAALKWIQANIDRFGGDSERVTVIGHGTGGAASHFHLLSPLSAGLFRSAISMSGSALNWWALLSPEQTEILKKSKDELYKLDLDALVRRSDSVRVGPVIDGKFLPDLPEKIIKSGNFQHSQWLVGVVTEEGRAMARKIRVQDLSRSETVLGYKDLKWDQIREAYFRNKKIGSLENLISDAWYNFGVDSAVRLMSEYSKAAVYYYRMNQPNTTCSPFSHGEELSYLFPMTLADPNHNDDENQLFRKILLRMISDFVRYGHPTVNSWNRQHLHRTYWRHFKSDRHEFIELEANKIKMKEDMFKERLDYWHNLFTNDDNFAKTEL